MMDFRYSYRRNLEDSVKYNQKYVFDELFAKVNNVDEAYALSIEFGRSEMEEFLRYMSKDYDLGLQAAAQVGDISKIRELIGMGAKSYVYGLRGAARGGRLDLFRLFLSKSDHKTMGPDLMYYAARGKNPEIIRTIELIYDLELKRDKTLLGRFGVRGAAAAQDVDLIDYFLSYPGSRSDTRVNLEFGLLGSIEACDKEMIEYFINEKEVRIHNLLETSALSGSMSITKFLVRKGAIDFDAGLVGATRRGDFKMIDYFIGLGATSDLCLDVAIQNQDTDVIMYLHGTHGYRFTDQSIYWATKGGSSEILRMVRGF